MNITSRQTSAGLILTRTRNNKREYLLLLYPSSKIYWGLCKGHVESGESKEQAALREATEETHLTQIKIIPDFEMSIKYAMVYNEEKISKEVTYFLAEVLDGTDGSISSEHKALSWLPYEKTIEQLRYQKDKNIVIKAERFLREQDI